MLHNLNSLIRVDGVQTQVFPHVCSEGKEGDYHFIYLKTLVFNFIFKLTLNRPAIKSHPFSTCRFAILDNFSKHLDIYVRSSHMGEISRCWSYFIYLLNDYESYMMMDN